MKRDRNFSSFNARIPKCPIWYMSPVLWHPLLRLYIVCIVKRLWTSNKHLAKTKYVTYSKSAEFGKTECNFQCIEPIRTSSYLLQTCDAIPRFRDSLGLRSEGGRDLPFISHSVCYACKSYISPETFPFHAIRASDGFFPNSSHRNNTLGKRSGDHCEEKWRKISL